MHQADLKDIVGSIPDQHNKVNIAAFQETFIGANISTTINISFKQTDNPVSLLNSNPKWGKNQYN